MAYDREGETRIVEEEEAGEPRPPWWRENWWVWLLALLLAVIALLAVAWALQRDEDEAADTVAVSTVPNVVGLEEEQAREAVEQAGYEPDVRREEADEPEGTVVQQDPDPGTELETGGTVVLTVSEGRPETQTETVTETETETETEPAETETETQAETETVEEEPQIAQVPDVVGSGHVEAGATVEEAGFVADSYPVPSQEPRGTVVAQRPPAGGDLAQGRTVRLNVSLGPDERPTARIPNITGDGEREARGRAREAGFTVRTLDREAPEPDNVGEVILQDPEPRTAPQLSQITIYVGR